ncbi:hypothetical protein [Chengkuizengella sediminis]|uniref:hypothetical protein n=1 Tax=Chengkuizengella sediminis TaxID=1885917 RepID=UPI0013897B93|nr:hypothetical protein [Chengkuizengella sediminis]NDI33624.1 hypothetical protein [Chengkuizengella sediminis]
MGHFDESICDCCVCPMQCVLEQLVGEEVAILISSLPEADLDGTLIAVNNFIATLDLEGNNIQIAVNDICAVGVEGIFDFKLKPIRKSVGECSCTEDPITNVAKSMIGESKGIAVCNILTTGVIIDVGEGIVIMSIEGMGSANTAAFSSCKIGAITPLLEEQNFKQKGKFPRFKQS